MLSTNLKELLHKIAYPKILLEAFSVNRHVILSNFNRQKSQAALSSRLPILFPVSSSDPVSTPYAKFGVSSWT